MSTEPKILQKFLIAPGNSNYISGDYGGYFKCTVDNGTTLILEATLTIAGGEAVSNCQYCGLNDAFPHSCHLSQKTRIATLEAALREAFDQTCPCCPDCNGCGNANDILKAALAQGVKL